MFSQKRADMATLLNPSIEYPEKRFAVELIVFGASTSTAIKRTIMVLASTAQGAKRICKARYRHSRVASACPADERYWPD
jgi:hypothetical protein